MTFDNSSPIEISRRTVFRDPSCGCYERWPDMARKAGYKLSTHQGSIYFPSLSRLFR